MKTRRINRLIAAGIAAVIFLTAPAVLVHAEGETNGKYVSDVFISYGKTQADAEKWLRDNGWEPIKGDNDFCAGKNSFYDDAISAAMGIRRTNDADEAITDMAVMNMLGGYSFPAYEEILEQKKADIEELINRLMDIISEYRDNYNGKGSDFGKKRAAFIHDILNRFYDGEWGVESSAKDTGRPLGDLLLQPLRHETGKEEGGDLHQMLLEGSGPAMLAVELLLSLAADTAQSSWLERLSALSEDTLVQNIGQYVPSAEGQNLPASAVSNLLQQEFGDTALMLSSEWPSVNEKLRWFADYNSRNDLWQKDGEEDAAYEERVNAHFTALSETDPDHYQEISDQYDQNRILYAGLSDIPYSGSWGETLRDFFLPADVASICPEAASFLPMAAVLSKGQRSSLEYISLSTLILTGMQDEQVFEQLTPDLKEVFHDNLKISIYTGVNRDIFRNGVAITSEALMEQNMGKGNAFNRLWDTTGIVAVTGYCSAVVGLLTVIAGGLVTMKGTRGVVDTLGSIGRLRKTREKVESVRNLIAKYQAEGEVELEAAARASLERNQATLDSVASYQSMRVAGRVIMGVGGVLMFGAAVITAVQLAKYYNRHFTPIPRMIVSESDIVTYLTDENNQPLLDEKGNQKKQIEFKDYEYYSAVKCNRPEMGELTQDSSWQDGVEEYKEHGCYDVADLNGDFGQEWLALYTVKSPNKGNPILADSLVLQYGSEKQPKGTSKCLHFFEYTYPMDMGDTAYSYNNKKGGVYFFWEEDVKAKNSQSASAFSGGQLAMAGAVGLAIGILSATFVLLPKRKREMPDE